MNKIANARTNTPKQRILCNAKIVYFDDRRKEPLNVGSMIVLVSAKKSASLHRAYSSFEQLKMSADKTSR